MSSTPPFPTNHLPRRSLPRASLPLASFDTIAGPRIDLDDLLLLRFVLRAEDKSRKIGAALEIVDDYPFDLRSERSQDVC